MNYLISYLIGSLLFGALLAKIFKLGDLSKNGSGNLGATNLARVSGKKWLGILAAILDAGKVFLAVALADNFEGKMLCGLLAIIGHLFPFWRPSVGGKGIASFFGLALALKPILGIMLLLIWAATFALSGLSSLSSLIAILTSLVLYPIFFSLKILWFILPIVTLILFKHKSNIQNIIAGQEKKL